MLHRGELKQQAKKRIWRNYLHIAIACLLLAIFAGAYGMIFLFNGSGVSGRPVSFIIGVANSQIIRDILMDLGLARHWPGGIPLIEKALIGLLENVFNNETSAGSFLFSEINALYRIIFQDELGAGIIVAIGGVVSFLYWIFVGNILRVGRSRFFLENYAYGETPSKRILFIYRIQRVRTAAKVMLCKTAVVILWFFTIIGGWIKVYDTRFVSYVVAENPAITAREALRLSKELIRGRRWQTFLLDLSFLPWHIFSVLTLGLGGALFVSPYRAAVNAELYLSLREEARQKGLPGSDLLNDAALVPPADAPRLPVYPMRQFSCPEAEHIITLEHDRSYSLQNLVLLFFCFALLGWLWEMSLQLFGEGVFANRGSMLGPWLPIYGFGGVFSLIVLQPARKRPVLTFLLAMVLCGTLEYFAGWLLEVMKGVRYWNYDGAFLNLNGRICFGSVFVFGIAACFGIYFVAPLLDDLLVRISKQLRFVLCIVLVLLFCFDLAYSTIYPNRGEYITYPLRESAVLRQDETWPGEDGLRAEALLWQEREGQGNI